MTRSAVLAFLLAVTCATAGAAYNPQPSSATSLQGSWALNATASDDVDKLVAALVSQEEKERRRWRKRMEEEDPFAGPDPLPNLADPVHRRAAENQLRRMLGVTQKLKLTQNGVNIEMTSDSDSRRFETGSTSQVSMRNGDLADCRVGWDGEWFVIDRKVPRGAREIEKLRVNKKTGQLEYLSTWSGDTELSGVKLRRVFDRTTVAELPADPAIGPVR